MSRAYYRKRSEATEQERVINWATFYAKDFPELDLLHHIPNGGSRNQLEAANLKRQGVKAGVPDLCLPVARNGKHGLYVEMKWGKNKTTDKQDWWLEQLRQQGYETAKKNDTDRIQPERTESNIETARHSQSSRKEAV